MSKDWRDVPIEEVEKMAIAASKWLASANGRRKLIAARNAANRDSEKVSKERVLDPQLLRMPINL